METYAGIDLGGTYIKGGIVSHSGELLEEMQIPTEADGGPAHVLDRMALLVRNLMDAGKGRAVTGVGIGVPGQVIVDQGLLVEAPNLPCWENVYVAEEMEERLHIPAILDNDANVAALGEYSYGAGRGSTHMLMVTLGTGVGGGLILNGEVFRGASGGAGEFGHMIIKRDGARCGCGRKGCVEAYVGTQGILRLLREHLEAGEASPLAGRDPNGITPRDISEAAEKGDMTARSVLREAGEWLGVGIGSVANLLNIDRVVIGGGVAAAGALIFEPALAKVKETALKVSGSDITVLPAGLGNRAGLTGAARLAMNLRI
ncbi:ROK family protein [bacterium]|nr:ROK family protein [bacterium]